MRVLLRLAIASVLAGGLAWAEDAADLDGLPPVPNPYGFDLRLALRTHLEEAFAQRDVVGLAWPELVERYRRLTAVAVPAPPAALTTAPVIDRGAEEAAAIERVRRDNILLQLARQFGEHPPADTPTETLRARLDALVAAARVNDPVRGPVDEPAMPPTTASEAEPVVRRTRSPSVTTDAEPLTAEQLGDATGVVAGVSIRLDGDTGDRLVGICFNDDLAEIFLPVMRSFAGSMQRAKPARTGLLLLGHGDGLNIGVGGGDPINLTLHLRKNVAAYHALLGVERIDCVAILSCSRKSDAQFTSFRDGLGYYPTWRVSAWEHTLQTVASGLAGVELALAQPLGTDFRAAVYHELEKGVASLAESGSRTSTQYLQVDIADDQLVFSPARRR